MRPLKTIIATAVIVFAVTAVAMAGVQHYTKAPNAQATGKATVRYTVTLTAEQLAHLMGQGKAATTGTVHRARHAQRHHQATHHQNSGGGSYRTYSAGGSSGGTYSGAAGHSSYRCYGNGHSGDCGDHGSGGSHSEGGGCW